MLEITVPSFLVFISYGPHILKCSPFNPWRGFDPGVGAKTWPPLNSHVDLSIGDFLQKWATWRDVDIFFVFLASKLLYLLIFNEDTILPKIIAFQIGMTMKWIFLGICTLLLMRQGSIVINEFEIFFPPFNFLNETGWELF